jgi:hypothetical protein
VNPVSLGTLIQRVRQRYGGEGGTQQITDWEITDLLNVSLANELYDLVRQAVGDQYYRRSYNLTMQQSVQSYDLPADFLTLLSVDIWLSPPTTPGAVALKINARRYMEYERNYYQQILLGWSAGATALYTLSGSQITFQPTPVSAVAVTLNYVPVSPQLGGGQNTSGNLPVGIAQPNNYSDVWDDINGWSELAVLDAAAKCCLKLNRLDMVQAFQQRNMWLSKKIQGLIQLRHAGEPERTSMPWSPQWGDGWTE